jgi:hypothetical protein
VYCKLYAYKFNSAGEVYAEGCNLEFLGRDEAEIIRGYKYKSALLDDFIQRRETERGGG